VQGKPLAGSKGAWVAHLPTQPPQSRLLNQADDKAGHPFAGVGKWAWQSLAMNPR